jgi:hypothetical protein
VRTATTVRSRADANVFGKTKSVGPKRPLESAKIYSALHPGAGAGPSGAPPTETGPTGLGSRNVFLRDVPPTRVRAFDCGMEEVVSSVIASTRANSEES